jgi:hypothetical protein
MFCSTYYLGLIYLIIYGTEKEFPLGDSFLDNKCYTKAQYIDLTHNCQIVFQFSKYFNSDIAHVIC